MGAESGMQRASCARRVESQWMHLAITIYCRRAEAIGLIDFPRLARPLVWYASVRKKQRENRVALPVCGFRISTPNLALSSAVQIPVAVPTRHAWKVGVSALAATLTTPTTPDPRHYPPHRQNIIGFASSSFRSYLL